MGTGVHGSVLVKDKMFGVLLFLCFNIFMFRRCFRHFSFLKPVMDSWLIASIHAERNQTGKLGKLAVPAICVIVDRYHGISRTESCRYHTSISNNQVFAYVYMVNMIFGVICIVVDTAADELKFSPVLLSTEVNETVSER